MASLIFVAVVTGLAPQICLAVATDLSLGPPMNRTVELQAGVDANEWAATNGLEETEERENSDGTTSLNFHMPDDEWEKREADICGTPGVLNCGENLCREFLAPAANFTGQVNGIEGGPVAGAMIVLVPEAPDVSEFVEEEEEDDDQALSLNLRPGKRRCSNDRGAGLGPIVGSADGSGKFNLGLPDGADFDPGCWELKAGNSCEAQSLPTRTVMPEREPKRILALLPGISGKDAKDQKDLANTAAMAAGLSVLEVIPLASIDSTLVRFEAGTGGGGADAALVMLQTNPAVDGAQPEYRYRTTAGTAGDDPYGWMNYGAEQIGAQRLHAVSDGSGVTVAVIDTGVDATHPELASRVVEEIDMSGFGMTPDRHGTAIAGIIAAESGNGIGSYGVAPGTQILAIKACEPETRTAVGSRCWSSTLAKALDHALLSDAAIINMSLGGPEDALIGRLLDKAAENGVLVLAAAGNDGPNAPPPFPASHPAVMAITAVDADDRLYADAVRGEFVDVAAPGVEIAVPTPGETYPAQMSGTSMATAYVAGAAALLLAIQPDATANALRQSLEASAVNTGTGSDGSSTGHGRIDVCGAASVVSDGKSICPK